MELLTCQLVALVVLVIVRLGATILPVYLWSGQPKWVQVAMSLSLSFTGGVVLATCFVHVIPQVRAALHYFLPQHTLPVTELIVVSGLFITFFLDEVFVSFCSSSKVHPENVQSLSNAQRPIGLRATILGLHGLAKGVALGLADSPWDGWFLLVASAVHEVVSGVEFCLYLLQKKEVTWLIITLAVMGSLAIVLGVALGALLVFLDVDPLVIAILRGLAAGNLLYLTFYELLTRKVRAKAFGLVSYLFALMGFLLMLVLQLFGLQELKYPEVVPTCLQETSVASDYNN